MNNYQLSYDQELNEYCEELLAYASIYSDLYKDLYGFRPTGKYPSTLSEYRKEVTRVSNLLRMEIDSKRKRKQRIINKKPYVSKPINQPFKDFYERRI